MIDDRLLPAAAHLTGADAADVLRPVVAAAGDELISCRTSQVQYRPESDLVVRYRCEIDRHGRTTTDTLLAATTVAGPYAGTVPVEATTADGTNLSVGVWRWPFDPVLPGLSAAVTPSRAADRLSGLVGRRPEVEVVAYRPTERAVVRVRGERREVYVKVVPAATTDVLVARHTTLRDAGLPVPRILAADEGWIAMEALTGTTLRDRLKRGDLPLPPPERFRELHRTLAAADHAGLPPVRSRLDDVPHHAAMLATVLPECRGLLDELVGRIAAMPPRTAATGLVHGDLHEAQLVVDDDGITGLLDVDDAGPGDPVGDLGTLLAHLAYRAETGDDPRIAAYAVGLRAAVAADTEPADVDRHVAAVLVGLATGPFRIQQPDWEHMTRRVLAVVDRHLAAAEASST